MPGQGRIRNDFLNKEACPVRADKLSEAETLQRAVAAQARFKFRFDVSQLVTERRIPVPKALKGEVLTDDFAAADVLDARGRRYRREK